MHCFKIALALICLMAIGASADTAFVYRSPEGFAFTITADGLTKIESAGSVIADGSWAMQIPGKAFESTEQAAKSLQVVSAKSVRVVQKHWYLTTTYDYVFDGEDLTIKARVENNHPTESTDVVVFGPLSFRFASEPKGHMFTGRSPTDIQGMHPGHFNKIGGSWATDGVYGIGLSPMNTGFTRTCLCWNKTRDPNVRSFQYSAQKPIPPGGAETFWMKMRVSRNTDWHHLLEPYKQHFLATYGPLRYKTDHRFYSQGGLADSSWRGQDNPFGFQQYRRIDLPDGAKHYSDEQVARLKAGHGQGIIFWAQGGSDIRGCMYRTDFDVLPPIVQANMPIIHGDYQAAGLKFGFCTRPGEFSYRGTYKSDYIAWIDPESTEYLDSNVRRFRNAIAMGASAFYLDSFGNSLKDVKAIKYYRDKLGPDIQTFAEMHCDAIVPSTGIYTEASYRGGDDPERAYALAWIDLEFVDVCRWMLGDMDSVVTIRKDGPPGAESVLNWLYRHHLTPMCQDWNFGVKPEDLAALQDNYVDSAGRWRN